jgi:hypothetical protein
VLLSGSENGRGFGSVFRLQYTTTSPKLHKVLGVETPVFD